MPLRARILLGRARRALVEGPSPARAPAGPAAEPDPAELAAVRVRFPPGSYYSPQPDTRQLGEDAWRARLWPPDPPETPGIDWRADEQLALLRELGGHERLELAEGPSDDPLEYVTSNEHNGMFKALDAWLLEGMLRLLEPRRLIEVGSGFSSLLAARVNRECLGGRIRYTAIEPHPRDFLEAGVPGIDELREERVQDTPLDVFRELDAGDVLFIDTSHAVKTGGDVPWIYNRVLPELRAGVVVHLHDVFLPFDYPADWVLEGWGWNEQYLVQAFLMHNTSYRVRLANHMLYVRHRDDLARLYPRGLDGGSLWLEKLA
jgi:hypothetical protein